MAVRSRASPLALLTACPTLLAILLVGAAVWAAWAASLSAPFQFDDHNSILDNATLRSSHPVHWLRPPSTAGETVSGRPVLNVSLALDAIVSGLDPAAFRRTNVLLHATTAVLLFLLIVHTGTQRDQGTTTLVRWGALAVTLLWAVHPLQTAAVTYVVQRAEILAAGFSLLTLYLFVRYTRQRRILWAAFAAASAMVAAGTKETAAALPLLVVLYDRTFVSGSFRDAWQRHRGAHTGIFASWLLLATLVWSNAARGGSIGGNSEISPWNYLLTQAEALTRYVGLVFWPASQVFDYGTAIATGGRSYLLLAAWSGLLLWACISLRRPSVVGFLAASFFLLLAPSSSFIPVSTQTMAEHRMYLPLAALLLFLGRGLPLARGALSRGALAAGAALIVVFVVLTRARNEVYRTELSLWQDTVAKRPLNPRAHHNFGVALQKTGRVEESVSAFERAIELQPNHALAHFQLGVARLAQRDWPRAARAFEAALAADPEQVDARVNYGRALLELGRTPDAASQFREALARDPSAHDARLGLAAVERSAGRLEVAEALVVEALGAHPEMGEAWYQRGLLREQQQQQHAAEAAFREAVQRDPTHALAHLALANTLAARRANAEAEAFYREAERLAPHLPSVPFGLGTLLARLRRLPEATTAFERALQLDPRSVPARTNLGNCLLLAGQWEQAVAAYEEVLRSQPDEPTAKANLQLARELQQRGAAPPER